MLLLRQPGAERVRRFLTEQKSLPYTYDGVGATESQTFPQGYTVDHHCAPLGSGDRVWAQAVAALHDWIMFDLDWCRLTPARPDVVEGGVVAVAFRHYGFWSLNSARIVYVIDEPRRQAFAYGTLPGHSEAGEERFQIERSADDQIYYDVLAFSKPRDLLPRLAQGLARRLQKQFVEQSMSAMKRAASR